MEGSLHLQGTVCTVCREVWTSKISGVVWGVVCP